MKPTPPNPTAVRKRLLTRITLVERQADISKKAAKQAKAAAKTAKKEFKIAKRSTKKARKELKTLKAQLAALAPKKRVRPAPAKAKPKPRMRRARLVPASVPVTPLASLETTSMPSDPVIILPEHMPTEPAAAMPDNSGDPAFASNPPAQ